LDDGQVLYLWVGKDVPSDFLLQLFGIPSFDGVDMTQITLPYLENDLSVSVNEIVNALRSSSPTYQTLHVIREGEAREMKWFSYFIEDKTKTVHSYYEFLVNLHQRVQAKKK